MDRTGDVNGAGARSAILVVESGPQRGARGTLAAGRHVVGSDIAGDMVVTDADIAARHFAIEYADGAVRLQALDAPLMLAGTDALSPGHSVFCGDAVTFQAGDTRFRIELPDAVAEGEQRRPPRWLVFGGSACVLFCMAIGLMAVARGAARVGEVPPRPGMAMQAPGRTSRAVVPAALLAALRARLDASGLETVMLSARDGALEANGTILPQEQGAWHDAQLWFDARFGNHAVLVDAVGISRQASPLAVQAVWTGPHPYVIDGAGQKLFAGAILRDGWVIESISNDSVAIRRDGETLAVHF